MVGALVYTVFDRYLVYFPGARSLVMGLLLIGVIFFLPRGIMSLWKKRSGKNGVGSALRPEKTEADQI